MMLVATMLMALTGGQQPLMTDAISYLEEYDSITEDSLDAHRRKFDLAAETGSWLTARHHLQAMRLNGVSAADAEELEIWLDSRLPSSQPAAVSAGRIWLNHNREHRDFQMVERLISELEADISRRKRLHARARFLPLGGFALLLLATLLFRKKLLSS